MYPHAEINQIIRSTLHNLTASFVATMMLSYQRPLLTRINFNPTWIITAIIKCNMKLLIHSQTAMLHRWGLGIDKQFHPHFIIMKIATLIHNDFKQIKWHSKMVGWRKSRNSIPPKVVVIFHHREWSTCLLNNWVEEIYGYSYILCHIWVWNHGICWSVLVCPRSPMLIMRRKINSAYHKIEYFTFSFGD